MEKLTGIGRKTTGIFGAALQAGAQTIAPFLMENKRAEIMRKRDELLHKQRMEGMNLQNEFTAEEKQKDRDLSEASQESSQKHDLTMAKFDRDTTFDVIDANFRNRVSLLNKTHDKDLEKQGIQHEHEKWLAQFEQDKVDHRLFLQMNAQEQKDYVTTIKDSITYFIEKQVDINKAIPQLIDAYQELGAEYKEEIRQQMLAFAHMTSQYITALQEVASIGEILPIAHNVSSTFSVIKEAGSAMASKYGEDVAKEVFDDEITSYVDTALNAAQNVINNATTQPRDNATLQPTNRDDTNVEAGAGQQDNAKQQDNVNVSSPTPKPEDSGAPQIIREVSHADKERRINSTKNMMFANPNNYLYDGNRPRNGMFFDEASRRSIFR